MADPCVWSGSPPQVQLVDATAMATMNIRVEGTAPLQILLEDLGQITQALTPGSPPLVIVAAGLESRPLRLPVIATTQTTRVYGLNVPATAPIDLLVASPQLEVASDAGSLVGPSGQRVHFDRAPRRKYALVFRVRARRR